MCLQGKAMLVKYSQVQDVSDNSLTPEELSTEVGFKTFTFLDADIFHWRRLKVYGVKCFLNGSSSSETVWTGIFVRLFRRQWLRSVRRVSRLIVYLTKKSCNEPRGITDFFKCEKDSILLFVLMPKFIDKLFKPSTHSERI